MRIIPINLGGFNLNSLEIESMSQAIHYLSSLHTAKTMTKALLITIVEHH